MTGAPPHGPNLSEHGIGRSIQKEINYSIPDKALDCYKFDGSIASFDAWKGKMLNHMARATQRYRTIIENSMKSTSPITMVNLKATTIDNFNAWEISVEVEAFTVRFLNDSLFRDRLKLSNNEELNGLELWRSLGIRFAGTGKQAVMTTGLQTFLKFAKCEDEGELLNHGLEWEKYLNLYGIHLKTDDATLRTLFLGIMPKVTEEKLNLKTSKYPTWRELMQYIQDKHEAKRQVLIAEALHRNKGSARKQVAHALTEPTGESRSPKPQADVPATPAMPSMQDVANMMNALAAQGSAATRARSNPRDKKPARGKERSGQGGKQERFIWKSGRCWDCGSEDHIRPDCPHWKSIIDSAGKPPVGYKGMKDKALQAWKDKRAKERSHMKALGYDTGTEDEDDEDSDQGDTLVGFNNAAELGEVQKSDSLDDEGETPNLCSSDSETEPDPDLNPHDVHLLNDVVYRRYRQKTAEAAALKAQKAIQAQKMPKSGKSVIIKSVADLDRPAAKGLIHALPRDRKSLVRLAKLCPEKEEMLGPHERWVMADSGSSIHAMDIAKELPGYEHPCLPTSRGEERQRRRDSVT